MDSFHSKQIPIKTFLDALAYLAMALSGVFLVVLVASFGWLVFGRYVLNDTPTWVEQMALLLVTNITFLAAAVGIHERTHLSVDILSLCVPKRFNQIINVVIDLTLLAFGVAMLVYGKALVDFAWLRTISLLGISDGVRYFPVVACGVLMSLFSGYRVVMGVMALFIVEPESEATDSLSSRVKGDQ
ncbi:MULTISPECIES: TRAP transporter small permease [Marinomonas]|jgi:TRAP-type transport system small permease protein|uniref:TRAP transporter small permease protein n=1 Tax=Marinomonas arctica TaxID=383750 RepID=A0A7H1J895_9GAMM|nr:MULTISPECIES: TRAP transporter small permease [Marinomonas]QNT06711.1 TRAP transporter small permease [Marinomonas arctica]GGN22923.1 C4-dicarboxylate ABC transporter permease [Marinomonas arctica]